jgi:hypothetical protein
VPRTPVEPVAYPHMKLDGVIHSTGNGDEAEVSSVKNFMSDHPNLRGLIGVVPTEAWVAAEAITQAGKIGQVFSAGNGDGSFGNPMPAWVGSGAAEFVFAGNPIKLGYLTVWAANYLLSGHYFKPAPTTSVIRSGSSGTTPNTESCGSASRSPSPRRTSGSTRTSFSGRHAAGSRSIVCCLCWPHRLCSNHRGRLDSAGVGA